MATFGRPLRVAIIGAGPAGFYTAEHLQKRAPEGATIDMFDRLPTPFGLVRGGVAPDHQKIKSVTKAYERIAASEGFRYYGDVEIGRDVQIDELAGYYDAVVISVGAPNDRIMGIDGEDLAGSLSATRFVAWYNGHPDAVELPVDLESVREAVVVGNGNVAVDVARILVSDPQELRATDIADHALARLQASSVRRVRMLGRRGPAQAAFTSKELRELAELPGVTLVVDPADVKRASDFAGDDDARRILEALGQVAGRTPGPDDRIVELRFLTSPTALVGGDAVRAVETVSNVLATDESGQVRAVPTDERSEIPAQLVLRAVGYRGAPMAGVAFDESRGVIPNERGRVLDRPGGEVRPGLYVAGWIKRGPQGVIGTNKADAGETVDVLLDDAAAGLLPAAKDPTAEGIDRVVRARTTPVDWDGWRSIDAHEREAGEREGRPRVKLVERERMRAIAAGSDPR